MANLLFAESFDKCTAAQLIECWNYSGTNGPGTLVTGRTGNGWNAPVSGSYYKTFTQGLQSTITYGYASNAWESSRPLVMILRQPGVANGFTFQFLNTGDGRIYAQLGDVFTHVTGSPSSWVQSAGIWYFIECQAAITPGLDGGGTHSTISVSYTLKVNGTVVLSGTLLFTMAGVYDPALLKWSNIFPIDGATIDDFYVTDTEFLGDIAITPLFPANDSATIQWTPLGGGSHYTKVNQHTPDDDTSYVSDDGSTLNHIDLYGIDQITAVPTPAIKGVQLCICVKNDVAGSSTVVDELKSGSTIHDGVSVNLTTNTYMYSLDPYRKSPFTTTDWTVAEINAMLVGIKRTA